MPVFIEVSTKQDTQPPLAFVYVPAMLPEVEITLQGKFSVRALNNDNWTESEFEFASSAAGR